MQQDMETYNFDITVFPTKPPEKPVADCTIPERLLKILAKYKYNWRLDQLSKPKGITPKFVPIIRTLFPKKKIQLPAELEYYSDQLSRPPLKHLVANKTEFKKVGGRKYLKKVNRNLAKAWGSIYNFYKFRERQRTLRQLKRLRKEQIEKANKKKKENEKELKEWVDHISKPKKVPKPPPLPPKKILPEDNYAHLDELATPMIKKDLPTRSSKINPAALTYEATENIKNMAKPPKRFADIPKPIELGKVKKSALRYKITPRLENMAQPRRKVGKVAENDDDFDPWTVSANAKKYVATARIKELAKPIERD